MDNLDKSKIWGIDFFYQNSFDPIGLKNLGASFCSLKAGEGLTYDVDFVGRWAQAKGILPRNAYWVLDPRYSSSSQSAKFLAILHGDYGEITPTVDFEKPYYPLTDGDYWKLPYSGRRALGGFIADFEQVYQKPMMIYSAPAFLWLTMGDASQSERAYYKERPLWIAEYPWRANPDILFWDKWTLYQFSENVDIGTKESADGNYFNGTAEDFAKFATVSNVPPIDVPPVTPNRVLLETIKLFSDKTYEKS